jgi:hypothetical protein
MERTFVLVGLLAGCGNGVSSHPGGDWTTTTGALVTARCTWSDTCAPPSDPTCEQTAMQDLATLKLQLDATGQAKCIQCMTAWVDMYDAQLASTCAQVMSAGQASAIAAACDTLGTSDGWGTCNEVRLPGAQPSRP